LSIIEKNKIGEDMTNKEKRGYFNLFLTFLLVVAFLVYGKLFPNINPLYIPSNNSEAVKYATLIVEPEENDYPIVNGIKAAQKSIDLEIYLLSDKYVVQSLIDAEKRGVNVRVILEENPYKRYGANKEVKDKLSHYGIQTRWANKVYNFTHSKFLVIDNATGYILTMNLTKSSFTKNREFGIIVTSEREVSNLEKIFQSDWERKPYTPQKDALIVSPENSREKLENFLASSNKSILIYAEEMEDEETENLLIKKAKEGISVYVILASPDIITSNGDAGKYLSLNGVHIGYLASPFVHAKTAVIDDTSLYVGSINFSENSIDKNREVGIIVANEEIAKKVSGIFYKDFENCSKNY
jgi:cardiolipin synthase